MQRALSRCRQPFSAVQMPRHSSRPRPMQAPMHAAPPSHDGPSPSSSSSSEGWLSKLQATGKRQSEQLAKWGLAGVVAYGAMNTVYYSVAFLFCWTYVSNVPKGQGLAAAAKAFLQVFATVWAGSQVTKLARAGLALVLAPVADRLLEKAVEVLPVKTKKEAFLWFLGICLSIAAALFAAVILAWQ